MSLIDNPDILPNVALVVYRHVLHRSNPIPRSDLEALCTPDAFADPRKMIKNTISELLHLRLLTADDAGALRLDPELPRAVRSAATGEALFRRTLRQRVLSTDNPRNHRMALAIAWYLAQPIQDAPTHWDDVSSTQLRQLRDEGTFVYEVSDVADSDDGDDAPAPLIEETGGSKTSLFIGNDTRWNAFVRWLRYLGLGWVQAQSGNTTHVLPDPTAAIREELPEVFQALGSPSVRVDEFLQELTQRLPVLDGGLFRIWVQSGRAAADASRGTDTTPDTLSVTLSHALWRLSEGAADRPPLLKFENRSDTTKTLFSPTDSRPVVPYSHVTYHAPTAPERRP